MINAVLVLPDHPGPISFDPTSIKDLKAGDPASGIELISPPAGNGLGTARVGFALQLPAGRGAHNPSLALAYDSTAGNGWVGVGWDLSVSSVQVDTRFGAPFHDGSERFTLDGEQLVPVGSGPCVAGGTGTRFAARVEHSFQRVVHCAAGTALDHFEVAQQDGVLRLYGVTDGARLADPADARAIGQWALERVVDAHDNLTLYRYLQDARSASGTRFDQNNAEDFRQLYLKEILYSGRVERAASAGDAASFLSSAQLGPYLVQLELQRSGAALRERPDIITSGRLGFKTVTRYRLGTVKVRLNTPTDDTIVREYRLTYEQGDFGKSRLTRVEQFGVGGVAGGALFYAHDLEYASVDDHGASAFSQVARYDFDQEDDEAATASSEWALGAHAYAGIGFTIDKQAGSVGARVGFNHRESTTHASLMDINGDGLPDRVVAGSGGLRVQLNDPGRSRLGPVAPQGDPNAGGAVRPVGGGLSLGGETGESVNAALQATFSGFSANVGTTSSWTRSSTFTLDADGDGLVDFVNGGTILFNQPRGTPQCNAGSFCFSPTKAVTGALDFGNLAGAKDLFQDDPAVAQAARDVERDFSPSDALQEWTAPFTGTVDISGALAWLPGRSLTGMDADGVRLRIYRNSELLAEYLRPATATAPTAVSRTGVAVQQGQRLYFVLSTLRKVAISEAGVPLEETSFAPVVRYTGCSGGCGGVSAADATLTDATGASLFTFDAAADFKLAGGPLVAVQAPRSGLLQVDGSYASDGAADDVRICLQHFTATQPPTSRACAPTDLLLRDYAGGVGHEVLSQSLRVSSGDSLVFRMETDFPIDPASVRWEMKGEMSEVCDAHGVCAAPAARDLPRLRFAADPFLPLHTAVEDVPLRPLVIPRDGRLSLHSAAGTAFDAAGSDQHFSARMRNRLLFKHRRNESRDVSLDVRAGDQISFQAHSPTAAGGTSWEVDAQLEYATSNGGTQRMALSVPRQFTNEMSYRGPLLPPVAPRASPFGGGFHGWRYGLWGGRQALAARPEDGVAARPEEPFDSELFYSDAQLELGGGDDRSKFHEAKGQIRDEESDVARRLRLYAPLVPRRTGTRLYDDLVGLKPEPAYVSADGATFVARGSMHGGQKGTVASAPGGAVRTVDAAFRVGDTTRASTSTSFAAGIGASYGPAGLSFNVSSGRTSQRMDVRDMNGDGILDVVVSGQKGGNGVRLTHLKQLSLRKTVPGSGPQLSESSDVTASAGLGLSSPVPDTSAGGNVRGMHAMFPTSVGVGLAATLSSTDADLVDVNGDGLPDRVRRDGSGFRVRLNLGGRFASSEDTLPVASWSLNGAYDPFASQLGVETPDDADDDETKGGSDARGALGSANSPDVVRRSSAVTVETNLGFTIAEDYGVTANWSSSLSGTQVVLMDVTGDGLPDYVRKSSGENAFHVKVNLGYAFAPEQTWPVPAWPQGVVDPHFKLDAPGLGAAVNALGLQDGIDTVEASGTHSRVPSVGFVYTIPVPLPPFGTPVLHFSFGGDVTPERVSGVELALQDVNGDGLADHVLKTEEVSSLLGMGPGPSAANRSAMYARINGYAGANLLQRIKRPLGGSISLAYERVGNTVQMPESRHVLTQVQVQDGTGELTQGHVLTTRYTYDGGHFDRAERDFLGFSTVTRLNPDGSRVIQTFANDTVARKGLLLREETRDAANKLFGATVNTYGATTPLAAPLAQCMAYAPFFLSAADYCAPTFTPLERSEVRQYEGRTEDVNAPGLASAQVLHYDLATGNVTLVEDLGDLADPSDDLHARIAYATSSALAALHIESKVESVEVRAGSPASPGALMRQRSATYDEHGDLVRQVAKISNSESSESLLAWNADGLLQTLTGPPNARGQRYQVSYQYDPVTRALATTISDSFGYTSQVDYDLRFQQAVRTQDVTGNVTEQAFDSFGRLVRVWSPYESRSGAPTLEVTYGHTDFPAWATTAHLLPDANERGADRTLDTTLFMDGLNRPLQMKKDVELEGHIVGHSVSGHVAFDAMGRLSVQGQTFFDSSPTQVYVPGLPIHPSTEEYDVLGRRVRSTTADGSVTRMSYDFAPLPGGGPLKLRSTVVDPMLNVRVLYRGADSNLDAVEEHIEGRAPLTRYERDPVGQLVRVTDAAGNVTRTGYDLLGRRTFVDGPDTGLTELRYDAAGNLVERVEPNLRAAGLAIRFEYDFNRLIRVERPGSDELRYAYGPPGAAENAAARLVRIDDEAGSETRGYGRLGEMVRSTRTVRALRPGDRERTFTTRFEYDAFGRMLGMVYPDGEVLRYGYDAGGLLRDATGHRPGSAHAPAESQTYLRSTEYDVFGQRTRLVMGNGVVSTYSYDPLNRRLATVTTRTPRARTLQAISYRYDRVGNVTGLVNALGQPVGSHSGSVSYSYSYDELYRLTSATGEALARPGLIDRFASRFAYDDIHNMRHKTQVHELLSSRPEGANAARPDASNHDEAYEYGGTGPHRATRIGDTLYTYDLNGNTLVECRTVNGSGCADTDGTTGSPETHNHYRRYVWTQDNTLRAVVHGGGDTTRFFYDAQGERVVKLGRGGTSISLGQFFSIKGKRHGTKHIFAGETRLASKLMPVPDGDIGMSGPPGSVVLTNGTGNVNGCEPSDDQPQKCPVIVPTPGEDPDGEPAVRPATYYYHPDHLGSTSWITDQLGKVHEHVEYYPFGDVWRDQRNDDDGGPAKAPNYLFTGKEFDEETGLTYVGARYYDSRHARWISPDPMHSDYLDGAPNGGVFTPVNLALYAYANNNPLVFVDPTGLFNVSWSDAGKGFVKGGAWGLAGGIVIGAALAVASPVVAAAVGGALVGVAVVTTGKAVYEIATGREVGTGRQLNDRERSYMAGELAGGFVGGAVGGYAGSRAGKALAGAMRAPPVEPPGPRLPQDVDVNPTAPRANNGVGSNGQQAPIGKSPAQAAELARDIRAARAKGATDIRVNQQQVNAAGERVGINRPDLQYTLNGKRFNVEYDSPSSGRGPGHEARIKANDPNAHVELKIIKDK
nr:MULTISPECIES: toxin TcdB middle/N-terminal domain-containing protein [Myxococcaceae]